MVVVKNDFDKYSVSTNSQFKTWRGMDNFIEYHKAKKKNKKK